MGLKIGVIIQGRTASTRLPNKVMLPLPAGENNPTILQWVVDRCCQVPILMNTEGVRNAYDDANPALQGAEVTVVVATTNLKGDDVIADYTTQHLAQKRGDTPENTAPEANTSEANAPVAAPVVLFRGDSDDVLSRYHHAAKEFAFHIVVRVTSDCPLIDPNLIAHGLMQFCEGGVGVGGGVDYLSNNLRREYPHGLDFEIMTAEALEQAYNNANNHQREHVTTHIRESGNFSLKQFNNPRRTFKELEYLGGSEQIMVNLKGIRVTIDTQNDYLALQRCVAAAGIETGGVGQRNVATALLNRLYLAELAGVYRKNPHLHLINNTEKIEW